MSLGRKIILPDEQASLPAVRRRDPAPHKPGKALWESNRLEQPSFQLIVGVTASLLPQLSFTRPITPTHKSQVIPVFTSSLWLKQDMALQYPKQHQYLHSSAKKCVVLFQRIELHIGKPVQTICWRKMATRGEGWLFFLGHQ